MSPVLKPLSQQVVVVTGASSGIGLATALRAAGQGARVVMAARSVRALDDLVARIEADGGTALAVPTDVADPRDLHRLAERAVARFGGIDTWINNAGVSIYGRLEDVDEDDSRRLFDVNFWGTVNGSLVALPWLRRQGGALINVGSEVPESAMPLQGMYTASKHAVRGFTEALRMEVADADPPVAVMLVEPTAVDGRDPAHARRAPGRFVQPSGAPIDPRRVAQAILEAATEPWRDAPAGRGARLTPGVLDTLPALAEWLASRPQARTVSR
jgi:NAD(P)-dependent dehydrogenase (short-subunit alcohol dehydrogenase family)